MSGVSKFYDGAYLFYTEGILSFENISKVISEKEILYFS